MSCDFLGRALRAASALAVWLTLSTAATAQTSPEIEHFETQVRPLLVEKCLSCHGPDKTKGGLRVDALPLLLEGGDTGPAVVPHDLDESLLIQAVRREDGLEMPPNETLTPAQIAVLEAWVAAGAHWPQDEGPAVETRKELWARHWAFQPMSRPEPPSPVAVDADWIRTPVDAFIAEGLNAAGLKPSPTADRRTLIRRLTYDLTGLPPTPEEVAAFVADPDPNAYDALVDRLLGSPHYGEQWARHWLDVARYSDTKGYVYGREERFFVQAPTYRDWVVNAFNDDMPYDRFLLHQIAADQAAADDRYEQAAMGFLTLGRRFLGVKHDIIDDRIDVVTRGAMGLTVVCARCHDHKYDPIPTADYYSLYGVFQNTTERLIPIAESNDRGGPAYEEFETELKKRWEKLESSVAEARAEASRRIRTKVADYLMVQLDLSQIPPDGFDTILEPDDLVPASARRWHAYLEAAEKADDPIFRPWRAFSALDEEDFAQAAVLAREALFAADAAPLNSRVAAIFATPPTSIREVAERYGELFKQIDSAEDSSADPDVAALRRVLHEPDESPCWIPDEPIVTIEEFMDNNEDVRLWQLQGEVDRWLIQSPLAPPYTSVVVDRTEIREPRIFRRGNAASPGDVVPRRFPQVVAGDDAPAFEQGSGRLELAQAVIDPENPLTARVWVNRIWAHHFGAGLVTTPSDFGIRAEPPSHPELLDWLARRMIDEGWSTKAVHRLILLSSTYRQTSEGPHDEEASLKDPENRLLWKMNPHRLSFEEMRDSLLFVAGELDTRLGGKASTLFVGDGDVRRTLYGIVDRQFLPGVFRVFDFANPDLHIPTRSETTVPQQALFALNHPFPASRARALASNLPQDDRDAAILALFQSVFQREATSEEASEARSFLDAAAVEPEPAPPQEVSSWSYGCITVDPTTGPGRDFRPLPFYNGSAWGGGPAWPDPALGWARITAGGGHPGNDLSHAISRRWTSPIRGVVSIDSTLAHEIEAGDGVRAWIVSSRDGVLQSAVVHNSKNDLHVQEIAVEPGDVIDFVVDIGDGLNSDDHVWSPRIRSVRIEEGPSPEDGRWDASRDFHGPSVAKLTPWEQLAQVLLMSNEFLFVD